MTDAIGLCARACIKLGADPIQSFDDNSIEARTFGIIYEPIRDSELSAHFWNFCTTNFLLSQEADAPDDNRYRYSFILPADHLRTIDVYDTNGIAVDYLDENGRIFSDISPVSLKYQRRVDEDLFPAFFQASLVARLAAEAAEPIIGEESVKAAAFREYNAAALAARKIDNQSNSPIQIVGPASSSWVKARNGWG